jgi:hypothetical protein
MLDFITEKFTELTSKCLDRNAKEYNAKKKDMQLVFKLDSEGDVQYLIYREYKPEKVVTFLQVLGVKLDFKGYSLFVPNFIKGALGRFCESDKIDKDKVRVILNFDERNNMNMWLYNNSSFVKQITLDSLFDTEDMITEE